MLMPLAVAVPCAAALATATLVAVPPDRFSVIGLLLDLKATVVLTAPATGGGTLTVMVSVPLVWVTGPVPVELSVTLTVKLKVPAAVGVPVIAQLLPREVPGGNAPAARLQL